MSDHGLDYLVNCSMLFTERPLLERPAAARAAGFDAIEFWWPWPERPVPADTVLDAFVRAIRDAGVQLIGLNFFAGDLAGPDAGVLSIPDRSAQFRDNLDVAVGIGEQLDVMAFNALYGNRIDGVAAEQQDELARDNLGRAADAAARIGATVLVEPVSGPEPYPLRTADDAVGVVEEVRRPDTRSSGSSATCFTWPTTATTSTLQSRDTLRSPATCRLPTIPVEVRPAAASWISTGTSATSPTAGDAGWVGLEPSRPPIPRRAWLPTPSVMARLISSSVQLPRPLPCSR